jgi:hypothetical protein
MARSRFTIRSWLVDTYRIRIWDLLCVDWRDIFVRTGHLLLHRDLLVVFIVATSTTLIPYSLRFIGLGI